MVEANRTTRATPAATSTRSRLNRYFQEAARLRLCLAYNLEDFRFAQRGGRIIYLFDANIIRFFMDPENERERVVAFRSDKVDYASATALVTAEFLFSRELTGQRSSAAFLAPAHGEEIAEMIDHLVAERHAARDAAEQTDANRESVQALLDQLLEDVDRGVLKSHQATAERLRRIVPGLADLLLDDWAPTAQLRRLYDRDLVRPLALSPWATGEILWPDAAKVAEWTRRIRSERRPIGGQASSRRNERDAEALLQVMMLDEEAAQADGPETKFVLVTADTALYSAYAKWFWNDAPVGAEETGRRRFVLRDPLQYVPILNMFEMPNGVNDGVLSELAADALDSLFSNLRAVETSFPHKLAYYRILAQDDRRDDLFEAVFGVNPLIFTPEEERRFVELRESWHRSFRTGVLLNVNLMQRRLRDQFSRLLEVMRTNHPLRQSIEEDQHRNLLRIQEGHAVFSTKMNVAGLIAEARAGAEKMMPRERIPFLVRTHRLHLPPEVERLLHEDALQAEPEQLSGVCAALEREGTARALLTAAAVAYRCGHWAAARIYARRAIASAPDDDSRMELDYILATSVRHALGELSGRSLGNLDVSEAENALEHAIRRGEEAKDDFACARAMVERLALLLNIERRSFVREAQPLEMESTADISAQAVKMEMLLAKLGSALYETDEEAELVLQLCGQAAAVTRMALVTAAVLAPEVDRLGLESSLRTLERDLDANDELMLSSSPMLDVYRAAAKVNAHGRLSSDALAHLKEKVAEASQDPWLTELDHAELKQIVEILGTELAEPIPVNLA